MELKLGLNNKHLQMAQWIALHPEFKLYEVAEIFGVTKEYVSMLNCTDAFQVAIEDARETIFSNDVEQREQNIQKKVYDNLEKALDQIENDFDSPNGALELKDVNRTVEVLASMTNLKRGTRVHIDARSQVQNNTMNTKTEVLIEAQRYLTGDKQIPGKDDSNQISNLFSSIMHKGKEEESALIESLSAGA